MKIKFLKTLLFPILGVTAISSIAVTSTSCGSDSSNPDSDDATTIAVTSVKIDKNDLIFSQEDIGKPPRQLHATVEPEDATDKNLIWSSSNTDVAMVDIFSGKIVILSEGTAEITVKSQQNEKAKDIGTIRFVIAPTQISVIPATIDLPLGQSTQLVATIMPGNADNKTVTWSTPNSASLKIEDGKDGSCTITANGRPGNTITVYAATYNGHIATCEVTITPRPSEN